MEILKEITVDGTKFVLGKVSRVIGKNTADFSVIQINEETVRERRYYYTKTGWNNRALYNDIGIVATEGGYASIKITPEEGVPFIENFKIPESS
jgi:hypothetical protein